MGEDMEYDGMQLTIFPGVYEPAEDSFLLAGYGKDATGDVLEIGCGSGIASLANARQHPANEVVGVDINPRAVACATFNAKQNEIANARFLESDLFSSLSEKKKFDCILFNPPYLPTTKKERIPGPLNSAFDGGGKEGRAVLDRFLTEAPLHLVRNGKLLFIQSSLNDLQKTRRVLRQRGFRIRVLAEESFFFERIYVVEARCTR